MLGRSLPVEVLFLWNTTYLHARPTLVGEEVMIPVAPVELGVMATVPLVAKLPTATLPWSLTWGVSRLGYLFA